MTLLAVISPFQVSCSFAIDGNGFLFPGKARSLALSSLSLDVMSRPDNRVEYGRTFVLIQRVVLRKPIAQAALTEPFQHQRTVPIQTLRPIAVSSRPSRKGRSQRELLLLVHAGWVGMALLIVTCIPTWKADFDRQRQLKVDKSVVTPNLPPLSKGSSGLADRQALFAGGSNSLVARTVGHAEGTRTPDGRKTRAYYGHKDPGNGAWNLGSFSFQHCREVRYHCSTPEEADDRQLQRLQTQHAMLQRQATAAKLQMTLAEELNGIDLANQAPLAALSDQGYVDRLLQVRQKGLQGQDAILEARVWSYWNPQTNRWDAPGLGNIETSIRHDQERRLLAIARALTLAQQQLAGLPASQRSLNILKLQPETVNPYSLSRQNSDYLWWEAGYWDAKLQQQRQVPVGYESAYDRGFANGSRF